MGFKFTLVLSRTITDEESAVLSNAGCAEAEFGSDKLPTNADVPVTKMDFDDTVSPSLAEAIESALAAVQKVPDLSVPGLTVPAQRATLEDADAESPVVTGEKPDIVAEERLDTAAGETPAEADGAKRNGSKSKKAKAK
jgi:hypothetical protein